jgi:predicted acyl esterase
MTETADGYPKSERREGMYIEWDVPIEIDDGTTLRCDVYRPAEDGTYPVIMSYGPYGKWLQFEQLYDDQWEQMCEEHPDVPADSSNAFQAWEVTDPEMWVPDGYAIVRVDSRGAARSEGDIDVWSLREATDYAQCIEWATEQPWSTGKIGLNGISYYAMNQWQVAALQPDGLTAMCAWEGAADWYRDLAHHGGIYCTFAGGWYERQVNAVQHGLGEEGYRSLITGDLVSGPESLSAEERGANRADLDEDLLSKKLATAEYWDDRNPDWSNVEVPFLSAANWGGQGLHPRGNFTAFKRAASEDKWLEVHGREHWTEFYTEYGVSMQKRFFGHFLKGEETGWEEQPRVQLQIRRPGERFGERHENEWPLQRTDWTRYYMDTSDSSLSSSKPEETASMTYDAFGDGVTFFTPPTENEIEITGPISSTLHISSETTDADLFVVVRAFHADMEEIVFKGALDPHTPIAQGWLRASHRKLDQDLSEPWQPYHTHDEKQPLTPGEIYELNIEVWPTCLSLPAGSRLAVSIRGNDYEYPGDVNTELGSMEGTFTGVGPFRHDDPRDRPADIYGGEVTLHSGPDHPSHVLLPIIPEK